MAQKYFIDFTDKRAYVVQGKVINDVPKVVINELFRKKPEDDWSYSKHTISIPVDGDQQKLKEILTAILQVAQTDPATFEVWAPEHKSSKK